MPQYKRTAQSKEIAPTGGKRAGAGRKPVLAVQTKHAEKLAKELRAYGKLGMGTLAKWLGERGVLLAIDVAEGKYSDDHKPNVPILKSLLEFLPKMVGDIDEGSTSPIADLVRGLKHAVEFNQINIYADRPPVEEDSPGRSLPIEGQFRESDPDS